MLYNHGSDSCLYLFSSPRHAATHLAVLTIAAGRRGHTTATRRKPEDPPAHQTTISPTRAHTLPVQSSALFGLSSLLRPYHGTYTHHPSVQMRQQQLTHEPGATRRFLRFRHFVFTTAETSTSVTLPATSRRKRGQNTQHQPKQRLQTTLSKSPGGNCASDFTERITSRKKNPTNVSSRTTTFILPLLLPPASGRYVNVEACWALFSSSSFVLLWGGKTHRFAWLESQAGSPCASRYP